MVTEDGLEGGAVYALSARLRDAIAADGAATLVIDFRPDSNQRALAARLASKPGQSFSTRLHRAGLPPVAAALMREAGPLPGDPETLARRAKSCPVRLAGTAPIARAISTAGGVAWSEVDPDFMLIKRPGVFVAGEMIDWEAPTGGYLLQACFSTGAAAGRAAARFAAAAAMALHKSNPKA
jgi:predicted flavoprotein YhiN